MRERPAHLQRRQITGEAFGEPATLLRTTGSVNEHGEYTEAEAPPEAITCATAPGTTLSEVRARQLTESGVQLDAARLFWSAERLDPVTNDAGGDIIVYKGERFRVHSSQPWGDFWEAVGVRQEGQPVA